MDSPTEQTEQQATPPTELAPPSQPDERKFDPAEVVAVAGIIAGRLGEAEVEMVRRVVGYVGPEEALGLLTETLRVEAMGGMTTRDGLRRRTPGGVFFHLSRRLIPQRVRRRLMPHPAALAHWEHQRRLREAQDPFGELEEKKPRKWHKEKTPSTRAIAEAVWARRAQLVGELAAAKQPGSGHTMKCVLVGRPSKISKQSGFVMTMMKGPERIPYLSKELPPLPPPSALTYIVYIPEKQWKKVEQAIRNPKDELVVEGFVTFDPDLKKLSIFVMAATTTLLQQAQREAQRAAR